MCSRVPNPWDKGIFSRPAGWVIIRPTYIQEVQCVLKTHCQYQANLKTTLLSARDLHLVVEFYRKSMIITTQQIYTYLVLVFNVVVFWTVVLFQGPCLRLHQTDQRRFSFHPLIGTQGREHPIGILLPGTVLLDRPVIMEFITGSFQTVFIWLTTEFSSDLGVKQVWCHNHCDITAAVTRSPADGRNLVHC